MSVTNIYLARHGETEYNRCDQIQGRGIDAPLNDTGVQQAHAIARYLQDVSIQRIVSSSLKRSRQTAEAIAKQQRLEVATYRDLDEMDFGILEGRPISEIKSELKHLHERWKSGDVDFASDQGESPSAVFNRANKRARKILEENKQKNLLFVLHGRLLRILLSEWLEHGLHNMHKIPHSNGALYHLQWNSTGFESLYINKTDHLVELDPKEEVVSK
ncbi:histidine phosphatase family protein [Aliifodinibius salipaludis]|uniref:Histidine phosphatase family protein n=1 Tax=Fodinibius salipaludis TaxID=2032627 RepID=A0A2A2G9U0_9BACT|nr:histidine phosphatase family protein [Aliifodinibius salipaludis]PAU93623.1 histidine phosphatase family protein [Aliifodinibius salipaludis]